MMMLPRMFLGKFLDYILSLRRAHDKVSRHPSWCWLKMFKSSQSSYPIHGWYGDWRCGKPHQKRHHINMWLTFGLFAAGMLFIKFCWDVSAGFSKGIEWNQRTGHDCSVASVSTDIRQGNAAEGASWQCQKWLEMVGINRLKSELLWNNLCFVLAVHGLSAIFNAGGPQVWLAAKRWFGGWLPRDDDSVSNDQCSNIFDIVYTRLEWQCVGVLCLSLERMFWEGMIRATCRWERCLTKWFQYLRSGGLSCPWSPSNTRE